MAEEIHVHIDVPQYEAARYAFRVLLADAEAPVTFHRTPPAELPRDAVLITYGSRPADLSHCRALFVRAADRLWNHYGEAASLPSSITRVPLADLGAQAGPRLQDPLAFPYVSDGAAPVAALRRERDDFVSIATGADVIASTFFWTTRYEELFIRQRDEDNRIPQALLLEVREALTARPLVDEYAELLRTWLRGLGSTAPFRIPSFRALLTHDVDTGIGIRGFWENAENGVRTLYREGVRGRRPGTGMRGLAHWAERALGMQDETVLFRDIVQLDAEFGFRSLFFLMANGTHAKDAAYDILGPASRRVIEAIRESGGDVGLHVGLDAHQTMAQFRGEYERLCQAAPSALPASRSHFLAFFPPATWRQLAELGCRVDSTLGFSHSVGFRGGTSRGFRPFDVERREVIPIWELPMNVMDVNLFHEPAADEARIAAVRILAERARAHGGCFVVNWHNVSFLGHHRKVYRAVLEDLRGAESARLDALPSGGESVLW